MAAGERFILVPINLGGNEIRSVRAEVLAVDPSGGALYAGRFWFNSTDNLLKYYNGTAVVELGAAAAGGVQTLTVDNSSIENIGTANDPSLRVKALGITNAMLAGAIALSKLATDPLARANHTGTQPASTISDFDAQVRTSRLDQMAAPTQPVSLNGQKITNLADPAAAQDAATQAYVQSQIAALVDTAPATLDTLNELAAALGDDPNFATTLSGQIGALDTRIDALEAAPSPTHKFSANVGDGAATAYAVAHNLNSRDVQVSVYRNSSPWDDVLCDVEHTDANTVTVRFATAPTAAQFRVVVVG